MTPMIAPKKILDLNKRDETSQKLFDHFSKYIIGQPQVVDCFTNMVITYQSGLCAPNKPAGNAIFLGGTGTGKTYTVECAAEALFGNPKAMLKIDCGEFQHSHEIAKLVGSPAGYLGHRETHPMFTQEVLNQYHNEKYKLGIVLFDEIEKASDSLWTLLLGVLDKATLTCGDNSVVNFSQQIVVLTSNLGVAELSTIMGERIGFVPKTIEITKDKTEDVVLAALKKKFTPEFLNRIDNTVVFNNLTEPDINKILSIEVSKVQTRIFGAGHCFFNLTPDARRVVFNEGYSKEYGARNLKRAIEKRISMPMARLMSSSQVADGDTVVISEIGAPEFEYSIQGSTFGKDKEDIL